MILVDTSAWIEFLRDTGSPVCNRVDELLEAELAICDPIRMEVLAGARERAAPSQSPRPARPRLAGTNAVHRLRGRRRALPHLPPEWRDGPEDSSTA